MSAAAAFGRTGRATGLIAVLAAACAPTPTPGSAPVRSDASGDAWTALPDAATMPSDDTAVQAGSDAVQAGSDAPEPATGGMTAPPPDPAAPTTVIAEPTDEASYIYDPQALRTYELLIGQSDLDAINADPAAEQYVPGMLRFEGRDYGPVGVRYKGSAGAFIRCVGGGLSQDGRPTGAKICRKLSMKVAFDWADPEGRFYGLRKLQFHAMRNDPSMMRERLGYGLFRAASVPSPRVVHARLLINGALEGAFALVEQIDGRFTRSRFSDGGEGNLYKEVWPMHDAEQTYIAALETNEDENPSGAHMLAFAQALEAAEGDALAAALETHVERTAITTYLAVDRAIGHVDGPLAFYCNMPQGQGNNPGEYGNHNYYWYEDTTGPRLWIIPWDLDFAFNGLGPAAQPAGAWDDPVAGGACECPEPSGQQGGFGLRRRPPGCDKLVQGLALLGDEIRERGRVFATGPFSAAAVDAQLAAWSAQIAELVAEQARDPAQPQVEAWQSGMAGLRTAIDMLRSAALQ